MKMCSYRSQRGAGLIVIIGVIAALGTLAAALVVLVSNVQSNTYEDRMRAKAFNVTEAAVDAGMYQLNAQWPTASGTGPDFTATAWTTAFRGEFDTAEFPDPASGQFVVVDYYDNQATIDKNLKWDMGQPTDANEPDNRMYIEAQAGVGPKATRIQALVERIPYATNMPRGIALVCGGDQYSNGGGNNPKITVEVAPPVEVGGGVVSIHVGGTIEASDVAQSPPVVQVVGPGATSPSEVFSPELVNGLTLLAKNHGRYFTSAAAADASPVDSEWAPTGGISGLCVIDSAAGYAITGDYNTEAQPGILLVLGGGDFDYGSGGHYYGVIYTDGRVLKGHGSYTVHGMLVADTDDDMRGTTDLVYNDNCIANLLNRFSLTVKQVPDTWREIDPI